MVPKPDFNRVKKKMLAVMMEQPGKAFTINQLQGACREGYDLVHDVGEYLEKAKAIRKHPDGDWCVGPPIREQAVVKGDAEDTLTKEIRALHREETHKGREQLPDLGG